MTKVHLRGRLGQEFGEVWELDVKTPKEALFAINVNTDGRFVRYIDETMKDRQISYSFVIGDQIIEKKEDTILLEGPCGSEDIYVTPVIGGSGAIVTAIIVNLIVAVILMVVSTMMAPSPQVDLGSNNDVARKDSYLFSGGPQPAKQGKPVPVGYGRMIVYPIAISVQYEYSNEPFGTPPVDWVGGGGGNSGFDAGGGVYYNNWGIMGGYYYDSWVPKTYYDYPPYV